MQVLVQPATSELLDNMLSLQLYDKLGRQWLELMLVAENLDYSSAVKFFFKIKYIYFLDTLMQIK